MIVTFRGQTPAFVMSEKLNLQCTPSYVLLYIYCVANEIKLHISVINCAVWVFIQRKQSKYYKCNIIQLKLNKNSSQRVTRKLFQKKLPTKKYSRGGCTLFAGYNVIINAVIRVSVSTEYIISNYSRQPTSTVVILIANDLFTRFESNFMWSDKHTKE